MHINRKRVDAFPCCCYMYLRLLLKIGFCFKIDYDIDIVAKIISKSQILSEVRYYLITGEKNNILEGYHRRTTLFLGVLSVKTAFHEYMVFFFLKKKLSL